MNTVQGSRLHRIPSGHGAALAILNTGEPVPDADIRLPEAMDWELLGITIQAVIMHGIARFVRMSILHHMEVGVTVHGHSSVLPVRAVPVKQPAALPAAGIQRRKPLTLTA